MRVDHAYRVVVNQLNPCNRYAHLNHFNRGAYRRLNAGERAHRSADGLRQRVQLDGDLSDDAQRAFTAHHEAR